LMTMILVFASFSCLFSLTIWSGVRSVAL
jgi:hypothetical protein